MAQTRRKSSAGGGSRKNSRSKKSPAKKAGTKKSTARKTSSAKNTKTKTASAQRNLKVVYEEPADSSFNSEIFLIICILVGILMFLSNFELLGDAGEVLRTIQFGLAGTLAYILPVYLILLAGYILLGQGEKNRASAGNILGSVILFAAVCGLAGLVGGNGADAEYKVSECYADGVLGINGGVIGGFLYLNLRNAIGIFGAYVVLVALAVLGFMFTTGRQILAPMHRSMSRSRERYASNRAYAREKEELRRQEEELAWEEEQQRRKEAERSLAARREMLEQRRSDLHARSLAFGEDTLLEPAEEENQDIPESRQSVSNPVKNSEDNSRKKSAADRKKSSRTDRKKQTGAEKMSSAENDRKNSGSRMISAGTSGSADADPGKGLYNRKKQDTVNPTFWTAEEDGISDIEEQGDKIVLNRRGRMSRSELDELDRSTGHEPAEPDYRMGYEPEEEFSGDRILPEEESSGDSILPEEEFSGDNILPEEEFSGDSILPEEDLSRDDILPDFVINGVEKEEPDHHFRRFEEEDSGAEEELSVDRPVNEQPMYRSGEEHREESENPAAVHPAEREVGVDESMSAYDDFHDAPDPSSVVNGQVYGAPGFEANMKNGSRSASAGRLSGDGNSVRSGKNHGENGDTSDASIKIEEKPVIRREYQFPPLSLLRYSSDKGGTSEDLINKTAIKLQRTLDSFGVSATVKNASCGPSVTRYELEPAQGVKVSRIVNLADDIKLNLAARDIRIEAPIPGKAAVGIEVPNDVRQTVSLKELLESKKFVDFGSRVGVAIGKNVGGDVVVADLAKMPHLLIAGATGSGKSVCINSLIVSILYKARPDEVKLILIDPKMVELSVYNPVPHLLTNVVTDPKKAAAALNWAVSEMTERYKRFAEMGCRDIKGYNKKIADSGETDKKMPQIVIIVDELADLMMVAANEVEESICRLAQLARAAGIHMVLATQRPSVNVITGLIKANVPSRIAFAVSSGVDSRTILDMNGAEKLLGNGDMLFYPSGMPKPERVQGAFVSDEEVQKIVDFLADHSLTDEEEKQEVSAALSENSSVSGKADAPAVIPARSGSRSLEDAMAVGSADNAVARDELFEKAGYFIIDKDKASIGNLQRAFRIGFNRAARIMDQLCDYGVVGPEEGTKARQILMTKEQFAELLQGFQQ